MLHPKPIKSVRGFCPDDINWVVEVTYADGDVEIWPKEEADDLWEYYSELESKLEDATWDNRPKFGPPTPKSLRTPIEQVLGGYAYQIKEQLNKELRALGSLEEK